MRTLFAAGAIGEFVKQIQSNLTKAGFSTNGVDGWFGNDTTTATTAFQRANSLQASGAVDDSTWPALTQSAIPPAAQRSLQLTAAFEGHGFELAVGNFDGALLTWGIIGFTLTSGEIPQIVQAINASSPQLLDQAFGTSKSELLQLMTQSRAQQIAWANAHTLPNGGLVQTWRSMFAQFGSFPEVQAEQLRHVNQDYLMPAIATAKNLGFKSELGLALAFDIHVQNGGIKSVAMDKIQRQLTPGMGEADLRAIVANAVADSANSAFIGDVRKRKLTIATGQGQVHGHTFVLENWGLSGGVAAAELN
jgi:peptidoglycan hydrolase-like protein with peptidoglycan-binding domain